MFGRGSPEELAERFTAILRSYVSDDPAERTERARRNLLAAIGEHEPATLNVVAHSVDRGAPAVSRSVETLVREGLVERKQDPANRRQLAMSLTDEGRRFLRSGSGEGASKLAGMLKRLAPSELRAVERAIEIFER